MQPPARPQRGRHGVLLRTGARPDIVDFNPTAENLARWICDRVPGCYKVMFQESEGNVAVYVKDGFENAAL